MLNQVVIVGRLKEIIKVDENKLNIVVSVPQSFKNRYGEYDVDLIDCELIGNIANTTNKYCNIGNVVGVKGKLKIDYYNKDDEVIKMMKVCAEKISILTSKSE